MARTLFGGVCLFCLLQSSYSALLYASEVPFRSGDGGFRVREPCIFHSSLPGVQAHPDFFFFFLSSFLVM